MDLCTSLPLSDGQEPPAVPRDDTVSDLFGPPGGGVGVRAASSSSIEPVALPAPAVFRRSLASLARGVALFTARMVLRSFQWLFVVPVSSFVLLSCVGVVAYFLVTKRRFMNEFDDVHFSPLDVADADDDDADADDGDAGHGDRVVEGGAGGRGGFGVGWLNGGGEGGGDVPAGVLRGQLVVKARPLLIRSSSSLPSTVDVAYATHRMGLLSWQQVAYRHLYPSDMSSRWVPWALNNVLLPPSVHEFLCDATPDTTASYVLLQSLVGYFHSTDDRMALYHCWYSAYCNSLTGYIPLYAKEAEGMRFCDDCAESTMPMLCLAGGQKPRTHKNSEFKFSALVKFFKQAQSTNALTIKDFEHDYKYNWKGPNVRESIHIGSNRFIISVARGYAMDKTEAASHSCACHRCGNPDCLVSDSLPGNTARYSCQLAIQNCLDKQVAENLVLAASGQAKNAPLRWPEGFYCSHLTQCKFCPLNPIPRTQGGGGGRGGGQGGVRGGGLGGPLVRGDGFGPGSRFVV